MEGTGLDRDQILHQTDRILTSSLFAGSERMSRFLRYIVTESVAGRGEQLKEYTIAQEAFQRPSTFDPQVDSTVRSEASRLRAKLQAYYETEGSGDPILISVPKGGYRVTFEGRTPRGDQLSANRSYMWLALLCLAAAAGGTGVWGWLGSNRRVPAGRGTVDRLTSDVGLTAFPALSTEGRLVAYASDRAGRGDLDIWIQPTNGKEAIRRTDHEADDYDPVFSPDGSQIAFRSNRDGGGIYLIAALGGPPRLVARGGRTPRFSPDGMHLAYSVENPNFRPHVADSGRLYVVPTSGGSPQQVQPQFTSARNPVWMQDGKHLLFVGVNEDRNVPYDWWVSSVPRGKAIRTGIVEALHRFGLDSPEREFPLIPAYCDGNDVVFSARAGDSVNLWRIAISTHTWKVAGSPQRMTFGAGPELQAAPSSRGEIAFTNASPNLDIWGLPIDAELGQVTGSPTRITNSAATDNWPSVTVDGKNVLFASTRSGKVTFWLKNLEKGSETELDPGGAVWAAGVIEKDGNSFLYYSETQRAIQRMDISTGNLTKVSGKTIYMGHTPDGRKFLHGGADGQIKLRAVDSGRDSEFLKHPKFPLHQAQLSRDGHWVVFYARTDVERSQIFIAPFREGSRPAEADWIPVTAGNSHEKCPTWSPDGNFVYFGSNRDGFDCIWGQRLHPESKRPVGPPVDLGHFHAAARRLANVGVAFRGLSVARDKVVFAVEERIGNIWLMR